MAILEVPLTSLYGSFSQNTVLDNVQYILSFRWNATDARWFMDIASASGVMLLAGIPLVMNYPLTYKFVERIADLPPGQFFVEDESGNNLVPNRDNLGGDIKLIYVEAAGV